MILWQNIIDNLDIIIPVYNGIKQVRRTIASFGTDYNFHFTIINDGDNIDYETELNKYFFDIHDIKIISLKINSGPGNARNMGLINTNRPLIMFIDAGDTLIDVPQFLFYVKTVYDNPMIYMSTPLHLEENNEEINTISNENNRMHGKLYRRDFLQNYNIVFNPEYAKSNEDIGFNLTVRLILENLYLQDNIPHCLTYDKPIVHWRYDKDSLTHSNNCAFYYKENNMGLAKNTYFAIKIGLANNVNFELIEALIYRTIASEYNFYYATKHYRPEFLQEQLNGAIYMVKYLLPLIEFNQEKLIQAWRDEMKNIFNSNEWEPFSIDIPDMNLYEWLKYVIEESTKNEYAKL